MIKKVKEIIPLKYDYCYNYIGEEGLIKVRVNDKWGFINKEGIEVPILEKIDTIGSRDYTLYIIRYNDDIYFVTGCFVDTLQQFKKAIEKHNNPKNIKYYNEYMDIIKKYQ